jgi:hypothetical protein
VDDNRPHWDVGIDLLQCRFNLFDLLLVGLRLFGEEDLFVQTDNLAFYRGLLDGLFDYTPQFGVYDGLLAGKGCCIICLSGLGR